jgi:hypothetical protein
MTFGQVTKMTRFSAISSHAVSCVAAQERHAITAAAEPDSRGGRPAFVLAQLMLLALATTSMIGCGIM